MSATLDQRCRDLVVALGLGSAQDVTAVLPLTGGVASDIALIRVGDTRFCAKFALPKLKVAADWYAPVHRNKAEYAWLETAARIAPDGAVRLFGRSDSQNGFVMEFLEGDDVYLWKVALLDGAGTGDEAGTVGDLLGRIHAASTGRGFDRSPFQNRDDFKALRIEPYLTFTAERHPAVAAELGALSDMLYYGTQVLVHGDVSPKNILFRGGAPVILDAECATMGDASFDPSFCLNHLILKAIHLPATRPGLLASVARLWNAYTRHVAWEPIDALEARVCRLIPALMLARVDGKSPVEYLDDTEKALVRRLSIPLLRSPATRLEDLIGEISTVLKG